MESLNRAELFEVFKPYLKNAEVRRYLKTIDDLNLYYFATLIKQAGASQGNAGTTHKKLYDGSPTTSLEDKIVPTAVAPSDWLKHLPYVTTEQLMADKTKYTKLAKTANLWIKKTQGGGGTSILRKDYLAKIRKTSVDNVKLGSKGTDLYVNLPAELGGEQVSLAEVQILQSFLDMQAGHYQKIHFQDIVSAESQEAVRNLWKQSSILNKMPPGFSHASETFQAVLPTLDDTGQLSLERLAPAGHGFFAFEALWSALENKTPATDGPLISVIGNGEDLGSSPDPAMVGWMIDQKVAIAMITTEKTEIDLKGGQIALEKNQKGQTHICLIEQAQAKTLGQLKLFEELGLQIKKSGQAAFFNTNVALFNYEVLTKKLKTLVDKIGHTKTFDLIAPTLIENKKTQTNSHGVTGTFKQLEGAMGSMLLNLDRVWRENFNEPLVHFINVERKNRSRFFAPVKTAFDFFMLFHSDRFSLDPKTLRLINHRPDSLPNVVLECADDPEHYEQVDQVLKAFEGARILDLNALHVKGKIQLSGKTLKGNVTINADPVKN